MIVIYSCSSTLSNILLNSFQILAKIEMTQNKTWLFIAILKRYNILFLFYFIYFYFYFYLFYLFYFILFYFILFYFILFYFILFYFI